MFFVPPDQQVGLVWHFWGVQEELSLPAAGLGHSLVVGCLPHHIQPVVGKGGTRDVQSLVLLL